MAVPRLLHALGLVALATTSGCYPAGNGRSPPLGRIYFPVGITTSPPTADGPARWLYVANSDFDLQYNAGTLQVFDLDSLRAEVPPFWEPVAGGVAHGALDLPAVCGSRGLEVQSFSNSQLYPGPCSPLDTSAAPPSGQGPFLADAVSMGAFATDMIRRTIPPTGGADAGPPSGMARLFLPVRGDAALDFIDVDENAGDGHLLQCGQSGSENHCDSDHTRISQPSQDANGVAPIVTPPDPYGVAADDQGEAVVVAHQSTGQVSLFVNDWVNGPNLQFVLGNLSFGAIDLAALPVPAIAAPLPQSTPNCAVRALPDYRPGFLLTFRSAAEVSLVRYFDACAANPNPTVKGNAPAPPPPPAPPFLESIDAVPIGTNSLGTNSRGITVDGERRRLCEAACPPLPKNANPADSVCLTQCAAVPLDVYLANRSPATLVIGQTRPVVPAVDQAVAAADFGNPSSDLPSFFRSVSLSNGPTQVVVGKVIDTHGKLVTRVFVVCFDARQIFIYDPTSATPHLEATIDTGRGPQAMAIDTFVPGPGSTAESHAFGYIAHFTDSYVGVVDLNQQHSTYGQILLTVGQPEPPRAQK